MIKRRKALDEDVDTSIDKAILVKNQKSAIHFKFVAFACLLYLFLSVFARIFVYDINTVSGSSMYPTLSDKDVVITETGVLNNLQRFDIVIIDVHDDMQGDIRIIKRIIGLPGERVTVYTNGKVAINNEFLADEYQIDYYDSEDMDVSCDVELDDDEYFVLGDNRYNSADSRVYGAFSINDIRGKVVYRLLPFKSAIKVSDIKMID